MQHGEYIRWDDLREDLEEGAISTRIDVDPELALVEDLLYDWIEEGDHIAWVAGAPVQEILDWAKAIREQEVGEFS
jgi:hypothetical protein